MKRPAEYAKALAGALAGVATAVTTALTDGTITGAEWGGIAGAGVAGFTAVYAVGNARSASGSTAFITQLAHGLWHELNNFETAAAAVTGAQGVPPPSPSSSSIAGRLRAGSHPEHPPYRGR